MGNVIDQGEICLSVLIMYIQGHQAQCRSMSINFLHVHTSTSSTQWGSMPLSSLYVDTRNIKHSVEACLSNSFMCTQVHQARSGEACLLAPFMWTQGTSSTVWKHVYELPSCANRDIKHSVEACLLAPFMWTQ